VARTVATGKTRGWRQAHYLAVPADLEQRSAGLNPELRGGPLLLAVEPVDPLLNDVSYEDGVGL